MYLLSLETSTKNFSLAVSKDDKVLRSRNLKNTKVLESSIIKTINSLLTSCKLSLKDMDAVAIGLGPGSFTSLRVGLSTVKAFAMGAGLNVVGVCSLDIIASQAADAKADEICVLVDARRQKVYAAVYGADLKLKGEYLLTSIDDVLDKVHGKTLFVGDAVGLYRQHIEDAYKACGSKTCSALFAKEALWYPQARELAKLALARVKAGKLDQADTIIPMYLYPQDCQVKRS